MTNPKVPQNTAEPFSSQRVVRAGPDTLFMEPKLAWAEDGSEGAPGHRTRRYSLAQPAAGPTAPGHAMAHQHQPQQQPHQGAKTFRPQDFKEPKVQGALSVSVSEGYQPTGITVTICNLLAWVTPVRCTSRAAATSGHPSSHRTAPKDALPEHAAKTQSHDSHTEVCGTALGKLGPLTHERVCATCSTPRAPRQGRFPASVNSIRRADSC